MMVFALSFATTGFWAYGPLVLKILFGFDPMIAGYVLAIEAIAWSLGTLVVTTRSVTDDRKLIRVGTICVAAGAAGFTVAVPSGSLGALLVCAVAQGAGFGISWPAIVTRCVQLTPGDKALASAAPATLQRVGYAAGTAFAGVSGNISGLNEGLAVAAARAAGFWVFASFTPVLIVAILCTLRFTRKAQNPVSAGAPPSFEPT
jgi:MFS family permease